MKTLTILFALFITACSSSSSPQNKSLFSLWETTDGVIFDLRGLDFGTNDFEFFFTDSTQCSCDLTFIGTLIEGNYIINNCFKSSFNNTETSCNALNDTGIYSIINNQLHTVDSSGSIYFN